MKISVSLTVNGKPVSAEVQARTLLVEFLRDELKLTGTHVGCDTAQCGACTILVDGKPVKSCNLLAVQAQGAAVTTIEGLATNGSLHPMQAAFLACDGYQCGYCTSGQIMSAVALLNEPCGPDDAAVKELMSGNICRCGAYANIVEAIQQVRKRA